MIKKLKLPKISSGKTSSKSLSSKRGDSPMDANSKNFEVELTAQEQTKEEARIPTGLGTAKIPQK